MRRTARCWYYSWAGVIFIASTILVVTPISVLLSYTNEYHWNDDAISVKCDPALVPNDDLYHYNPASLINGTIDCYYAHGKFRRRKHDLDLMKLICALILPTGMIIPGVMMVICMKYQPKDELEESPIVVNTDIDL